VYDIKMCGFWTSHYYHFWPRGNKKPKIATLCESLLTKLVSYQPQATTNPLTTIPIICQDKKNKDNDLDRVE
jgi:hypothetical protein